MATPEWVRRTLQLRGVPFEEVRHLDVYTAQELAQREHVSGHRVAKVVVVMADGRPVELVLPASRRVVMDLVRDVLGAREVRLATEAEMAVTFNDCEVGAIPPLNHWRNVDVIMDRAMDVEGEILFQAGTHHDAVRLQFDDWFQVVRPRVESFSLPEEVARAASFSSREG